MSILERFYTLGGYESASSREGLTSYVSPALVTGTYIPFAVSNMNLMCSGRHTVSVDNDTTGDPYDDRILAHLALEYADTEYDKVHLDPDTGARDGNRHQTKAVNLILNAYGVRDKYGRLVLPVHSNDDRAAGSGGAAESDY